MYEPKHPSKNGAPDRPEWYRYSGILRTFVMCNALLAFALELAMLAFVAWWALALDLDLWARAAVAVGALAVLIALWGTFAAPKARVRLPTAGIVAVKAVAFGSGALALWGLGFGLAAIAFAVLAAANTAVTTYVRRPR
ncbi:YrdB family protein [Glycomyces paridis]|uniref:DUF2568 domain-containing protein n=1 Tax=Glycomyces paridis TaxID=2126555 RepID=A0A4S8PF48_9ACTN|nr:YrdB family protein [Glycomyces paridis]THV28481.1 DUF2568 domain-containing protein [Glycomyces paridis]